MRRRPEYAKLARMLALMTAKDLGLLHNVTLQELADLLDVEHRSTILRDLREVEPASKLAGEYMERLRNRYENSHANK